jgi:hypothetical protein
MVIRRIMELLLMFWKKVVDGFSKVCEAVFGGSEEQEVEDPLDRQPYRKPEAKTEDKDEPEKPGEVIPEIPLVCTVTDTKGLTDTELGKLKEKTRRRALRHFAGKEVRHRVTEKKNDLIEFAFFRTSSGSRRNAPVKIRWQKPSIKPASPTSNEKPAETGS